MANADASIQTIPDWRDWSEIKNLDEAAAELTANSWLVIKTDGPTHVVPHQDLREHNVDEPCWCDPRYDEGVMVHNSMDKREAYERGEMMQL